MSKKIIRVKDTYLGSYFTVRELLEYINNIENLKTNVDDIEIGITGDCYDGHDHYCYLEYERLETDQEYVTRLEKEEKLRQEMHKRELMLARKIEAKEKKEFQHYLKLKAKFEGVNEI